MRGALCEIILTSDPAVRDRSLDAVCRGATFDEMMADCRELELLRHRSDNLYERVRACFFLYAIHRYHLPTRPEMPRTGRVPYAGHELLLQRRFEEAVALFLHEQSANGPSDALSSALAAAYHRLGFQTLSNQVRRSVRSVRGNQWMFRIGHPADQPLRVVPELLTRPSGDAPFPVLCERTPVRMDLTHSGWSDIFFLGMDYPEGARVLNVSIDLAVVGRDASPRPPVEAYLRVIDEPVLRLASVDLGASAEVADLAEVFDFARDYLGLLKAALIASGVVPPGLEGSEQSLQDLLERLVGAGNGLELVSSVNGIPKGSRLAVSTNLLACLISVCMRATGQTMRLTGVLDETERRAAASRAILGEWLAGSGGGWQDSGGVWPGIKLIQGQAATEGDPEWGISRGRLLPSHRLLGEDEVPAAARQALQDSLVLVHGGMAQNVGPILEMVTEKYLLRSEREWASRRDAAELCDAILGHLRSGDIRSLGQSTTANFVGPLQGIIPWASNLYTERLIGAARTRFGSDFWGFWMLGGMSGGGMGFIFSPQRKQHAAVAMQEIMASAKSELGSALPFAMDPVVYDFSINERGTCADLLPSGRALLPAGYYAMTVPTLVRSDRRSLTPSRRADLDAFAAACRTDARLSGVVERLFDALLPPPSGDADEHSDLAHLLDECGFDQEHHEQVRRDMLSGRIGLAQNLLPTSVDIRDIEPADLVVVDGCASEDARREGARALSDGEVAVLSLAAGVGSRWTQGAGVVKALHPFARLAGSHRSFVETHLAKTRRAATLYGCAPLHVFTTSYMTHEPMARALATAGDHVMLSPGRSVGLRMIPTVRDLRFAWEEMPQQVLDEQQQKVREGLRSALLDWARTSGEGSDYVDNVPLQCLHPVGHWYEVPNMLKNGVMADLLRRRPGLRWIMLHNIDTLGADADAGMLGTHILSGADLTFEVVPRRVEDRGGGLARVDGKARLVEGLAMPHEETEFGLTYYNSMTTWISVDALLRAFGLTRETVADPAAASAGVRALSARMPTYLTIKDVKKRWGHGHEDVFPVVQFEKLWGDMTALRDLHCGFAAVSRFRGQQLKEQAQLDGWLRDGSADYVGSLCEWSQ